MCPPMSNAWSDFPRNVAQKLYLQAMQDFDITIAIGPAGTGKTFLAVAAAAAALHDKEIKRIGQWSSPCPLYAQPIREGAVAAHNSALTARTEMVIA